jgi:ubiquinone/menaquinone biosynthesis C-methylase UbiE
MLSEQFNRPQYLETQYHDAVNLNTRINIHDLFSINHYGWSRWVFDKFNIQSQSSILELGCGTGGLWQVNLRRVPVQGHIILTDFSEEMLQQARQNLLHDERFEFRIVDAQQYPLPFRNASFDMVIANHMLYHISDRQSLFSEITRILKPKGSLYASTVGQKHLIEITEMLVEFDPVLSSWGMATDSFTLENGTSQLSAKFTDVRVRKYTDALVVTEVEPLIEYILSGWFELRKDRMASFRRYMTEKFKLANGIIHIAKDSGIFEANNSH